MHGKYLKFLLIFLLFIVGTIIFNYNDLSSVSAQSRTTPPKISFPRKRGTPPAKNTTGSRGYCPEIISLGGNSDYTLTINEYPTFWFYIPYSADRIFNIEFELQYKNGDSIETIPVTLSTSSSLISIRLSKPIPTDRKLLWYLTFKCKPSSDSQKKSPSDFKSGFLIGFVQKIVLDDKLNQQLNMTQTPLERISIYTKNGIWYDTVTELLTQPDLQEFRHDFFKEVGLDDIFHVLLK